ncbi:MAG: DsbA family oxidoreductase [Myxococcaceae bacterium]
MGAPITVTVFSDYVCPWCFVGTSELATLKGEFDFVVDWRPFLLRPDTPESGWELPERIRASIRDPNNPLKQRADKLGITINHRLIVPSSRRAHECTEFARQHGKLEDFHHELIERYWSKSEDLHDWAVLKAAATKVGLDADAMEREVSAGQWKGPMEAGLAAAEEIGVSAVPTFIIGNKFAVQGAQDARVFRQAFERLKAGV